MFPFLSFSVFFLNEVSLGELMDDSNSHILDSRVLLLDVKMLIPIGGKIPSGDA